MTDELVTLLFGMVAGRVAHSRNGRLTFTYESAWREGSKAGAPPPVPLSLSLPLGAAEHGHKPTEAFLWGLLPDSAPILEQWGRRFQVSPRSPFALVANVGEDCAGAVQFIRPERVREVRKRMSAGGLRHPIVDRLVEALEQRAKLCLQALDS